MKHSKTTLTGALILWMLISAFPAGAGFGDFLNNTHARDGHNEA
ncbi:MAG: hypothetical protein Q8P24_06475 [Desulfobacterales bacterium]|nr:hypothetical protein [Desulfobacterales bacterium]